LAGRVDCIAEWNGQLSVIDFKTSTREKSEEGILNYFMQCTAYALMFEEITGKTINKIVVAIATEDEVPQIFIKDKSNYINGLNTYIQNYWDKR
jgi:genome maintenance exonuclease 1